MADEAGLLNGLWRPQEFGFETARMLIPYLESGLKELLDNPDKYKKLNPKNGWGSYDGFVKFVQDYLAACKEHPDGEISAYR